MPWQPQFPRPPPAFPIFIGAACKLRSARSALNLYSVALDVLPASSVLESFLDCGPHKFPSLSEATVDSSDCPELQPRTRAIGNRPNRPKHHPPAGSK